MFIGHLAGAELLHAVIPEVPAYVSLIGIGFPDLLWGVTILAGLESAKLGTSPLQRDIEFTHYPISHSLVLTNVIALIPAIGFGLALGWQAGLAFLLASISHWLLDVVVHKRDLPVLGFGRDIKVGLGLWRWGKTAFFAEFALVVVATLIFEPSAKWLTILVAALVLHLFNVNSFFGFTRTNPMHSAKVYGVLCLVGFSVLAVVFRVLI
jgi:hypothetical protein